MATGEPKWYVDSMAPSFTTQDGILISNNGSRSAMTITNSHIDSTEPGKVQIDGTLYVNGVDVAATMGEIMQRLMIIQRDVALEERYPGLKAAYDNYQRVQEQCYILDILKGK